jgi:hypothetical protein
MDYTKQGGGTRVLDPLKARTLATGSGQTGSMRADRVAAGIRPGQTIADRGIKALVDRKMPEEVCHMDPINNGQDPAGKWPLESGSKSHAQANGMFTKVPVKKDQGDGTRVPTTGRRAHGAIIKTTLSGSGL